ncbi:hypothetical protein [Mycolicibacterium fluoranthenivorans]|uniref:Uncharacterized protein n=1 Tax=Mycolicibacterium fluoranthenivorans TaxID=258505 RepID=A0A7X5TZL1_9MYCO|nr:hypothetical protein [Mycolicibacterium fluoranthenivorans]MCV7358174.1 hypothetical protein [Mycolicibacterium fluoranthenivorans]NIH95701.1 hypothetical protein [Mycolicibacterium fluoranthenivorans]
MTDLLEVSGPASLAALVSALAPGQPRPLGHIASLWLEHRTVFAVAHFDALEYWPFTISVQPTSLGHAGDVRRESKRLSHRLRSAGWTVRHARTDDRAIA